MNKEKITPKNVKGKKLTFVELKKTKHKTNKKKKPTKTKSPPQ